MTRFLSNKTRGFTLIELLVVIAILAILATVIVVIINPGELLKQSRDTNRLSDLASLNKTLGLLLVDQPTASLGRANVVYVSVPDTSLVGTATSTCATLGLPTLPTPYTYECHSATTYRKTDGTGWIPIDFSRFSTGNILSRLPVDPINTTSTGQYYTYFSSSTSGMYEITAMVESEKQLQYAINDSGYLPGVLEKGSQTGMTPPTRDKGLVGYWTFDEGTGVTAYDSSLVKNNGTLTNGPTWQTSTNCKKGGCVLLDGIDDYIVVPHNSSLAPTNQVSYAVWANRSGVGEWRVLSKTENGGYNIMSDITTQTYRNGSYGAATGASHSGWNFIVGTFDGRYQKTYIDGVLTNTNDVGGTYTITYSCSNSLMIGAEAQCYTVPTAPYFSGYIDDVRIYNRALSAAEISAIYNATR